MGHSHRINNLGRAILLKRQSIIERLPGLTMPTLIMVGSDDLPRPPSESQLMASYIKNANLVIIPNTGHICCLEDPAPVTQALENLLRQI